MNTRDLSTVMAVLPLVGILAMGVTVAPIGAQKEKKSKKQVVERFEARAMNLGAGAASMIEIGIMEWTGEQEREALVQAFNQGGNKAAYDFLGKLDEKAFMSLPNSLGYQMRYAFQFNSGGKRQIILGTNRPIAMGEVMSGSQSQKANISLVVLDLDAATNEGTGEVIMGAEFKIDQKTGKLEIETLSNTPTRLTLVKPGKVKKKKN